MTKESNVEDLIDFKNETNRQSLSICRRISFSLKYAAQGLSGAEFNG